MTESTARIGRIDISEAQAAADYLRAHVKFISQHKDLNLRLMRLGQNKTAWITYWDTARHVYVFEPGLLMECLLRSHLCPDNDDLAKVAKKNGVDFYKLERKALEALTERDRARREKEKQRAAATAQPKPKPGTCRFCGCTETTPCDVGVEGACAWIDKSHTACSNPKCLRRFNAEKAAAKKPKGKK